MQVEVIRYTSYIGLRNKVEQDKTLPQMLCDSPAGHRQM